MTWSRAIVPAYLLLCLLLGGASAAGFEGNLLLQLLGVALLAVAFAREPHGPMDLARRQLVALLIAMLAMIAVQLVPLPPALWTALPGRDAVAHSFQALDITLPWLPMSLSPHNSLASGLWLIPAIAVLVAMVRLEQTRGIWLAWSLAGFSFVSIGLAAVQAASGEGSPAYLYEITNWGVGVGFFANANHQASLLLMTIPFLAALYLSVLRRLSPSKASAAAIMLGGAVLVVFVGLAVNRSLAGIGLSIPVLAASVAMVVAPRRRLWPWSGILLVLLTLGSVALVFSEPFGNNLTSSESRRSDSRLTSYSLTLPAARDYLPVGSGIGSFQEVYRSRENPAHVDSFYMNHAHSDLIELTLETGVPGLLVLLLFLMWWTKRAVSIWRGEDPAPFAQAATIASAAVLAHSLVDYPLRTAALSALFAACCALMVEQRPRGRRRRRNSEAAAARHLAVD